jgi:hypothetical protein
MQREPFPEVIAECAAKRQPDEAFILSMAQKAARGELPEIAEFAHLAGIMNRIAIDKGNYEDGVVQVIKLLDKHCHGEWGNCPDRSDSYVTLLERMLVQRQKLMEENHALREQLGTEREAAVEEAWRLRAQERIDEEALCR